MTRPRRIEVLGNDDWGRQFRRYGLDEARQRLNPAGRSADDDELVGGNFAGQGVCHGAPLR
ncbi:MAG: hypothetical protein H0V00_03265 [Chloroflexia bacterium]|nr:hypothetical protein [Chloroflexia bacterium]